MSVRYPVTRYVYRPLSLPTARLLSRTGITPRTVTWASAVVTFAGAAAFARSAYLLGAILCFLGVILDCADGDLARVTGRSSRSGAFLDSVLDRWTDAAMILGLGYSDLGRFGPAAGAALTATLVVSYTRARAQSLGVDVPDGIGGRDTRFLVLVVTAAMGWVLAGLIVTAAIAGLTAVQRALLAGKQLGRLDAADPKAVISLDANTHLDRALRLAHEAHAGQIDKVGRPYIEHLQRVMDAFDEPTLKTIAVLHDIIEDTGYTADDLRNEGFRDDVVEAVVALSKRPDETYEEFVRRAAANPLARRVKAVDLRDNLDQTSAADMQDSERERLRSRFTSALEYVESQDGAETA